MRYLEGLQNLLGSTTLNAGTQACPPSCTRVELKD